MSKKISAMMLSSNMELWQWYQDILGSDYKILLLPVESIEQSKEAIREKELVIMDVPSDEEEWLNKIQAVRQILGKGKALCVHSNLPQGRKEKILNVGEADECFFSLVDPPQAIVGSVSNIIERYRHWPK